jgi:3-deoxy-D-manno-octulosonic-acid transferase
MSEHVGGAVLRVGYTLLWWLLLPAVALYLLWRSLRQREYRDHWRERFFGDGACFADAADAARPIVWMHAVSVGETRAAQPLLEAIAREVPAARFVLTHMTPTGRATGAGIAQALPGRVLQRYLPYDVPFAVRRFLRQARPSIGVVLETEAWPNMLFAARAADVPMVLANARLSERSLAKALRWPVLVRAAVACFTRIAAQTEADRARLAQIYEGPIDVVGNLKFDLAPVPDQIDHGRALRAALGARPVWLFASTREGEEALLLAALEKWGQTPISASRKMVSDPIFLVVPRHPQRFDEVAALFAARGWRVVRRSEFEGVSDSTTNGRVVLLGDSMGEMPLYYAMADVTAIGGSWLPLGGQNLIEACACGCPVIVGPHMFNFAQATEDALAAGAAMQVNDLGAALAAMESLMQETARLAAMKAAAFAFAQAHRGATARTAALIHALLDAPRDAPMSKPLSAPASR